MTGLEREADTGAEQLDSPIDPLLPLEIDSDVTECA